MRALAISGAGRQPEILTLTDPKPDSGEVLVRVAASSVNGFDVHLARAVGAGSIEGMMEHRYPIVLGKDFAGTVEAVGESAERFAPGEKVFGVVMKPVLADGAWSELLAVSEQYGVAAVPEGVDLTQAGALGLAGTAGLQAVEALADVSGRTVLISGATGGVGTMAVQYAKAARARVVATARPGDEADLVRGLGADEVVDYTAGLEAQVHELAPEGVDAVLHFAGDAEQLLALLREGGPFVSTLGFGPDQHPAAVALMADPNGATLERLAADLAAGRVRLHVEKAYRLEEAPQAIADFSAGSVGKLALKI